MIWQRQVSEAARPRALDLFSGSAARATWSASLMMTCIILGIWSSTFWIPALVTTRMTGLGRRLAEAQQWASLSGIVANPGTLAGCLVMPYLADLLRSRRVTAAVFFVGAFLTNVAAYIGCITWANDIYAFSLRSRCSAFSPTGCSRSTPRGSPNSSRPLSGHFGSGVSFSFGRLVGAVGPATSASSSPSPAPIPSRSPSSRVSTLLGLPVIALGTGDGEQAPAPMTRRRGGAPGLTPAIKGQERTPCRPCHCKV